jgi:DNA-nicking Smr family endonuclease
MGTVVADLNDQSSSAPKESCEQADEHQAMAAAAKESSGQADEHRAMADERRAMAAEHRAMAAEPQLPVARLLDDPGLRLDEGAPRRSMSSLWEPDVGPDDPSPFAPKWVRDAASRARG